MQENNNISMPYYVPPTQSTLIRCALESIRSSVHNITDRNLVELAALVTGKKKTVRLVLSTADWIVLKETISMLNLLGQHAEFKIGVTRKSSVGDQFTTDRPWDDEMAESILVYVAKDEETITDALEKEGTKSNDNGVGELLGYPDCCISSYRNIVKGKLWVNQIVTQTKLALTSCYSNKLAYLFRGSPSFLPDYYPCSLCCTKSATLGKTFFQAMCEVGMNELAQSMKQKLMRPILFVPGLLIQFKQISILQDRILFDPQQIDFYSFGFLEAKKILNEGQLSISINEGGTFGQKDGITYRLLNFTDLI